MAQTHQRTAPCVWLLSPPVLPLYSQTWPCWCAFVRTAAVSGEAWPRSSTLHRSTEEHTCRYCLVLLWSCWEHLPTKKNVFGFFSFSNQIKSNHMKTSNLLSSFGCKAWTQNRDSFRLGRGNVAVCPHLITLASWVISILISNALCLPARPWCHMWKILLPSNVLLSNPPPPPPHLPFSVFSAVLLYSMLTFIKKQPKASFRGCRSETKCRDTSEHQSIKHLWIHQFTDCCRWCLRGLSPTAEDWNQTLI